MESRTKSKKRSSPCSEKHDASGGSSAMMPQETSQPCVEAVVVDSTLVNKVVGDVVCAQHEHSDAYSQDESSGMPGVASLTTAATADTCFSSRSSLYVGGYGEEGSVSSIGESETSTGEIEVADDTIAKPLNPEFCSYKTLRVTYLLVILVVMLADGLQGTHLYVLYESYGFSVASLYCLGFGTGGLLSFLTGPLVDHMGRKKAALLYCGLEIFINLLEQYPFFYGLVASRMIGGFTTNLLSTVFETWLDTEYRKRSLAREKYETVLRESVIVSNLAAIGSGYLAHVLAEWYGPVGPFQGAVSCTAIALVVIAFVWSENYGTSDLVVSHTADDEDSGSEHASHGKRRSIARHVRLGGLRVAAFWNNLVQFLREAVSAFSNDTHMLRVGISQGLSAGSLQIFVFLWAPMLRDFALSCPSDRYGLDMEGMPAYGLIFGGYMCFGVLGGFVSPPIRRWVESIVVPLDDGVSELKTIEVEGEGIVPVRPMAVEVLVATCYLLSALVLFVPYVLAEGSTNSFSIALTAFLMYEMMIGVFLPFEGVMRSLYFPSNARASIMTLPRLVVNVAVALGVVATNYISFKTAFGVVGCLMVIASALQLSLVSEREWLSLFSRANNLNEKCVRAPARRLSSSIRDAMASSSSPSLRRLSSNLSESGDPASSKDKLD